MMKYQCIRHYIFIVLQLRVVLYAFRGLRNLTSYSSKARGQVHENPAYISVNNHHITVIFMSKNKFLGSRNSLEQTKISLLQCEAHFSRWLPRWPLFQKNASISANTQHIKVILVLKSRFLRGQGIH